MVRRWDKPYPLGQRSLLSASCQWRAGQGGAGRRRSGRHTAEQHMAVVADAFDLLACLEQFQMSQRFPKHQPVVKGIMSVGKRLLGNGVGGLWALAQGVEHH